MMKTSEIFAACIPLIESGEERFICHSLCRVITGDLDEHWESFQEGDNPLYELVMVRLSGHSRLLGFAYCMRDTLYDILDTKGDYPHWFCTDEELKDIRVLWLKSLVTEFQQLGD